MSWWTAAADCGRILAAQIQEGGLAVPRPQHSGPRVYHVTLHGDCTVLFLKALLDKSTFHGEVFGLLL